MADFYKNSDHLCDSRYEVSYPAISGIQYHVITDLTEEPVDIDFFKAHAHIDWNTDDNLIASYIKSARQYLERWSQLSFGEKTMKVTALRLPANHRLMFGPVDTVEGHENLGDTILNGIMVNANINYTTKWDPLPEDIKIAICKRAAGDYLIRENYIVNERGSLQDPGEFYDEAQKLVKPYMNITFP